MTALTTVAIASAPLSAKTLPPVPPFPFGIVVGAAQSYETHLPAPGVCVEAMQGSTAVQRVLTDASGRYEFAGLPAGSYSDVRGVDCTTGSPLFTTMGIVGGFTLAPGGMVALPFLNIHISVPAPCTSNCPRVSRPTPTTAPGVPTNVKATITSAKTVVVTWSAPTTGGGLPWGVYIVRSYPGGAVTQVDSSVTSVTFPAVKGHRSVAVTAENQAGIGPDSVRVRAQRIKA